MVGRAVVVGGGVEVLVGFGEIVECGVEVLLAGVLVIGAVVDAVVEVTAAVLDGFSVEDTTAVLDGFSVEDTTAVLDGFSVEDITAVLDGFSVEDTTAVLDGFSVVVNNADETVIIGLDVNELSPTKKEWPCVSTKNVKSLMDTKLA